MGCTKSKAGSADDAALPAINLAGLDGPSKFEAMLPFKRYKVDALEAKFKVAFGDNNNKSLPLEQFKDAFKEDPAWNDLWDQESLLVKLFNSNYFCDESGNLDRDALIVYAVLLSPGDASVKARVLYDVL